MSEPTEPDVECLAPDIGAEIDDVSPPADRGVLTLADVRLVSRAAWGARAPRSTPSYLKSTRGVKVHYTGGFVDPRLVEDHRRCAPAVRGIQNGHMDGNGWSDIGYSLICCAHRYVFIGRGVHRLPAANGPGLNSGHYAVLGLVGNRGLTQPPDAMLHGIRDAIEYLRDKGGAGKEIKGHRDGYSTSCPGEPLYAWVRKGASRPGTTDDIREDPLLGLEKGHKGEPVKALQEMIRAAGQGAALGATDGDYGAKTAEALRQVRLSVGSTAAQKAGSGDRVDAWAYSQLHSAVARHQSKA